MIELQKFREAKLNKRREKERYKKRNQTLEKKLKKKTTEYKAKATQHSNLRGDHDALKKNYKNVCEINRGFSDQLMEHINEKRDLREGKAKVKKELLKV